MKTNINNQQHKRGMKKIILILGMICLLVVSTAIAVTVLNRDTYVNSDMKKYIPDKATFTYTDKNMSDGRRILCVFITVEKETKTIGCSSAPDVTRQKLIYKYLEKTKAEQEYKASKVVSETEGTITIK